MVVGDEQQERLPRPAPAGIASRSKILIVDDNTRNLNILRTILSPHYIVDSASSGEEALAVACATKPDLVLLDIMMPGIDGYETCRRLRADRRLRWAKIIMVSAKAMVSERLQGYEAGAHDYVTKPFDEEELLAKVRVHLRMKSIEEVNDLKTAFLGLFQHETRTPLTGILGAAELLLDDVPIDTASRRELAGMIHESAARLHDLLARVLMLAELKAGVQPFEPSAVDLPIVVGDAIATTAARASDRRVTVQATRLEAATVRVDREWMTTAIRGLLDNAIRFSAPDMTVVVEVVTVDGRARLTVADRGPGIAAEFLPSLFDEFISADMAHHHDGAGLSLAIARRIVEAHEGHIGVESEPGAGSTFTIDLPLAPDATVRAEARGVLS